MIFTGPIVLRLVALAFAVLIFQLAFLSQITIAGSHPDIVPALVVVMGLLGGSLAGAVAGFSIGLFVDSALIQTMGASSLVLLGVGYLAGRFREIFDITNELWPPLVAGGLTALAITGYALIQFLLGVDAPVSALIVRDLLVKSALAVVLSIPLYVGTRRIVRAAMIDDRPRRRRAQTVPMGIGRR